MAAFSREKRVSLVQLPGKDPTTLFNEFFGNILPQPGGPKYFKSFFESMNRWLTDELEPIKFAEQLRNNRGIWSYNDVDCPVRILFAFDNFEEMNELLILNRTLDHDHEKAIPGIWDTLDKLSKGIYARFNLDADVLSIADEIKLKDLGAFESFIFQLVEHTVIIGEPFLLRLPPESLSSKEKQKSKLPPSSPSKPSPSPKGKGKEPRRGPGKQ
ncbi:MAG: hypothetical protein LBJ09_02970 [Clostridiales bacterium]|nr:hypothetical protein [Clostridiales bacterium]